MRDHIRTWLQLRGYIDVIQQCLGLYDKGQYDTAGEYIFFDWTEPSGKRWIVRVPVN